MVAAKRAPGEVLHANGPKPGGGSCSWFSTPTLRQDIRSPAAHARIIAVPPPQRPGPDVARTTSAPAPAPGPTPTPTPTHTPPPIPTRQEAPWPVSPCCTPVRTFCGPHPWNSEVLKGLQGWGQGWGLVGVGCLAPASGVCLYRCCAPDVRQGTRFYLFCLGDVP